VLTANSTWSSLQTIESYLTRYLLFRKDDFPFIAVFISLAAYLSDCSCNKLKSRGIYGMRWSKEWMVFASASCGFLQTIPRCIIIKTMKKWWRIVEQLLCCCSRLDRSFSLLAIHSFLIKSLRSLSTEKYHHKSERLFINKPVWRNTSLKYSWFMEWDEMIFVTNSRSYIIYRVYQQSKRWFFIKLPHIC
jgi:hypothetical protein